MHAAASELHAFRIARPVFGASSRLEATTVAALSMVALLLWLVVLPLEFALIVTV